MPSTPTGGYDHVMLDADVSENDTKSETLTRRLSGALARVVAHLELDQPPVVTTADLERIIAEEDIGTAPRVLAARLRHEGWLLPLPLPGVWEFAPGAHAGPIGRGDPFILVRAISAKRPRLNPHVCGVTAMWAHSMIDRFDPRIDVAISLIGSPPASVRELVTVTRFEPHTKPDMRHQVPILRPAALIVHAATHPTSIRWGDAHAGMAELIDRIDPSELTIEVDARPESVRARVAYLIHGVRPDLAEQVLPEQPGRVWFGPRRQVHRYCPRFGIADTLLPFDPSDLNDASGR
jgi:hypothetical protein